ncbi:MAG: SDR family oxidoreductase [Anaerolineae bacterium]|nr:SDR family oxidoreductase [Anaerolineae bacterium]
MQKPGPFQARSGPDTDLRGQTAIVTGGGTGIGQAVALALGAAGVRVVIAGRRLGPIQATAQRILDAGGDALPIQADVSQEADAERLVRGALEAFGALDILVNNAAVDGGGYIHDHDIAEWDRIMANNLRGPFLMCRFALPHMRARRRGHIINISSESGVEYYEGNGAYGVSKHGLNALGEYVQRENQAHGIRVNTICPGMVVTEMSRDLPGLDLDLCLMPSDIADLVTFLLTRSENIKIGLPILIQTMRNPWAGDA